MVGGGGVGISNVPLNSLFFCFVTRLSISINTAKHLRPS